MKSLIVILLFSLVISSCSKNVKQCVSLGYRTLVVSPFIGDNTVVTEDQPFYSSSGSTWARPDNMRNMARLMDINLKDRLQNNASFQQIVFSKDCQKDAVKAEGEMTTFFHHKRSYYSTIRYELIDCNSGKSIYNKTIQEGENTIGRLPERVARRMYGIIHDQTVCTNR